MNINRSGRRRTERVRKNINLLQEKLLEDPIISDRKNGLGISKSTFNRITERDMKWHTRRKKTFINEVDLLKENHD